MLESLLCSYRADTAFIADGLRFAFTQVDPDQPARQFTFSVVIDPNGIYQGMPRYLTCRCLLTPTTQCLTWSRLCLDYRILLRRSTKATTLPGLCARSAGSSSPRACRLRACVHRTHGTTISSTFEYIAYLTLSCLWAAHVGTVPTWPRSTRLTSSRHTRGRAGTYMTR